MMVLINTLLIFTMLLVRRPSEMRVQEGCDPGGSGFETCVVPARRQQFKQLGRGVRAVPGDVLCSAETAGEMFIKDRRGQPKIFCSAFIPSWSLPSAAPIPYWDAVCQEALRGGSNRSPAVVFQSRFQVFQFLRTLRKCSHCRAFLMIIVTSQLFIFLLLVFRPEKYLIQKYSYSWKSVCNIQYHTVESNIQFHKKISSFSFFLILFIYCFVSNKKRKVINVLSDDNHSNHY